MEKFRHDVDEDDYCVIIYGATFSYLFSGFGCTFSLLVSDISLRLPFPAMSSQFPRTFSSPGTCGPRCPSRDCCPPVGHLGASRC